MLIRGDTVQIRMEGIVVVGHDAAVQAHATRYARLDGAAVRGVVTGGDSDQTVDGLRYESVADALAETDVDGVDVCGPGFAHPGALTGALDAGVPVRCDPPFALSESRFDDVVSLASDGDGWVAAHSPHRFSRLYEQLRSAVEAGSIGDVGVARVKRTAPFDAGDWNASYDGVRAVESFEDALCAVVAHDVDVFEWTFGPVERAFARAREGDRCDHVHAVLAFREGGRGTVETTWCADSPPAPRVEVEYSGSHGRLDFDDGDVSSTLHAAGTPVDVDPPEDDCRGRCLHQFVESLRGGDRPPAGVEPTGPSRVAVAMRRSIAAGEPRTLAEASR